VSRSYLLIESRGTHESPDVGALFDLGRRLREAGHETVVYLVQNAVFALGRPADLEALLTCGVRVWADEPSLAARGLDPARRPAGVTLGGTPDLVRLLMTPDTVPVWH
jgi:hypothetical protein